MEAYIKKYFWTLNLVTIALCSYMAAKTTNLYLGEALYSEPDKVDQTHVQPQKKTDITRSFEHKAGINPFTGEKLPNAVQAIDDSQIEVRDVEASAEDVSAYDENSECAATSITGTLMGTMVSSNPESSFAIIEINGKAQMFEVRQSLGVGDAHVVGVFRHKVIIRNNGRIECFFHGEQGQIAKAPATAVEGDEGGEGIRKISETEYIISQDEINKAIDNINLLMTQARVVPSFKDGKSNGFRIYSIKPGSLYRKIGIKNGDILQKVNENELSSPEKALELYTKLRTEKRVTINLLRRGQPVSLDYTIQ